MPGEQDEIHLCFLITMELFKVEEREKEWIIFSSLYLDWEQSQQSRQAELLSASHELQGGP